MIHYGKNTLVSIVAGIIFLNISIVTWKSSAANNCALPDRIFQLSLFKVKSIGVEPVLKEFWSEDNCFRPAEKEVNFSAWFQNFNEFAERVPRIGCMQVDLETPHPNIKLTEMDSNNGIEPKRFTVDTTRPEPEEQNVWILPASSEF
jgi:hypothetical protein